MTSKSFYCLIIYFTFKDIMNTSLSKYFIKYEFSMSDMIRDLLPIKVWAFLKPL